MKARSTAILVLLACLLIAALVIGVSSTSRTCLQCRATKKEYSLAAIPFSWIEHCKYSAAYQDQDGSHMHQWRWCGSTQILSVRGAGIACGRRHPIYQLPSDVQQQYAGIVPAADLNASLKIIDSPGHGASGEIERIYQIVLDSRAARQ